MHSLFNYYVVLFIITTFINFSIFIYLFIYLFVYLLLLHIIHLDRFWYLIHLVSLYLSLACEILVISRLLKTLIHFEL